MKTLFELERKHYGFCAWIDNGDYISHIKLIGYSKTAAIRQLRHNGVVCPVKTYRQSKSGGA